MVLGAGIAGLLAARVLSDFFESVTVVERDRLPDYPAHRKGVPQGRHVHQFLTRGTQVFGELFPGILDELVTAGAVVSDPSRIYTRVGRYELNCTGRLADPDSLVYYQASRPFMEFHVRRRVAALDNVTFLDCHEVVEPVGTADAVTGIRIINRDSGITTGLNASLVVDAMGRATRAPAFLESHGFGSPPENRVAAAGACASHLMNIPDGRIAARLASMLNQGRRSTLLLLMAYEHDTWMLAIGHTAGQHDPPTDFAELISTADGILPPAITTGLRDATPIGDIAIFRNTAAIWRRYDRMPHLPGGVVVIGDALCSRNPLYGQGMATAAVQALLLRDCLRDGESGLPRRFFTAVAEHIGPVWAMNAANRTSSVSGTPGLLRRRVRKWATDAALKIAACDIAMTERFFRVANLVDPPSRLQDPALIPRILLANLRRTPQRKGPPCPAT